MACLGIPCEFQAEARCKRGNPDSQLSILASAGILAKIAGLGSSKTFLKLLRVRVGMLNYLIQIISVLSSLVNVKQILCTRNI